MLVLKHYFNDPRDPRDRLAAEWSFLRLAWARAVRAVPEPLACDAAEHVGLYGFVPGRKLSAAELEPAHIEAAVDFILAVNAAPCDRAVLAPASEACFSLAQHISTVERRITRLSQLDAKAPQRERRAALCRRKASAHMASREGEAGARGALRRIGDGAGNRPRQMLPVAFGFRLP